MSLFTAVADREFAEAAGLGVEVAADPAVTLSSRRDREMAAQLFD